MKKSKIIVPALAMIGLSAVASVTGSVAWFTAQRTGRITTQQFVVTKIDGDLNIALTEGAGTNISGTTVQIDSGAKSKDVSFDPKNHQLYNAVDNATSFVEVGGTNAYEHAKADHPYVLNGNIYYAFTWKVTISMNDTGYAGSGMNVFFDYRTYNAEANIGSKMEKAFQDGETGKKEDGETDKDFNTSKGFRIAMISPSKTIIYAGLEDDESELKAISVVAEAKNTYAYGTSPINSGYSYFGADAYGLGSDAAADATAKTSYLPATDGEADQDDRADYLGTLTNTSASTRTMDVWCVAWYEGTDKNIVNGSAMEKVASSIGFYSTSLAA